MRRMIQPLALPLLVLLFTLILPGSARSEQRCDDATASWVGRCAARHAMDMTAADCPAGVVVIDLHPKTEQRYQVELSRRPEAFRKVGDIGLSPIGEFPDWSNEPPQRRAALDALAECVATHPPDALLDPAPPVPGIRTARGASALPWLLIAAMLTLTASFLLGRVAAPGTRKTVLWIAVAMGSVAACFLVRRALVSPQFLHQNGQGPLWIEFALVGSAGPYGPGWPEVFHWIVRGAPRADTALMTAQELGAAVVPFAILLGLRGLGLSTPVAGVIAAVFAFDPVAMRMARSESYLATIHTLLCLAAAALMSSRSGRELRQVASRALGFAGAGLLVAQAIRIHPLAWVPAALLPLVLLIGRDPWRKRLLNCAFGGAVVGLIVATTSVSSMLETMRGSLGQAFLPGTGGLLREYLPWSLLYLALACLLFIGRRTRPFATPVLVLAMVLAAANSSAVLARGSWLVDMAYLHCFAPVAAAGMAGLVSNDKLPARWVAVMLGSLLIVHGLFEWRSMKTPTDAAELAWCQQWRETLPAGAEVAWLRRAGNRTLELPLHGRSLPVARPFRAEGVPAFRGSGPRYYYRGSLCSTPEGEPHCAAFERSHRLRLVDRRVLLSVPSLRWLPLPEGSLEVQLLAVE